ncbi:aminopeptidase P family protein [Geomonas sp. Red32]|uniref:M24 family metallopeptidase n=1 Tax=Geomonas sp. Red32 TaxID=2912856 RepID=UPI00202CC026|nr:aminopeptidase P family protein [Geomonas sp. Red32]MCM0083673.1 aminopeptidase P family protein [Geomonas sp. Red32]
MLHDRISAARGCLQKTGADLLLVTNLSNIRYLTGFTGSEALLVVSPSEAWFLTDSRYTSQAGAEVKGAQVVEFSVRLESLAQVIKDAGAAKAAFEAGHLTVQTYQEIRQKLPGVEFIEADAEMVSLRTVKDAQELEILEKAAVIASESLLEVVAGIKPGMVESEVAWALEKVMRSRGADGKSFDFIIASGERGALPHGKASGKTIQAGELITFDYGIVYQGYCSDETVTVALGEPDGKQREVYETVREAQRLAIEAARPGMAFNELDAIAREYIGSKGYGQYFGHGLGHGVGIDIHEHPTVSPRSTHTIREGMVFTVEPGIYIPGWGGVRIEDTVVMESGGSRRLTKVPKELIVLKP